MPFALVMYFDHLSEEPIWKVRKDISDSGITSSLDNSGIRPHLTLNVFNEVDCLPCEEELAAFARKTRLMSLQVSYIGFFTNPDPVVFIAPTPTKELMIFHQNILSILPGNTRPASSMYLPGTWVPHCTLALDFEKEYIPDVVRLCLDLPLPFTMRATQVGVVEFQPIKDLYKFNLTSE